MTQKGLRLSLAAEDGDEVSSTPARWIPAPPAPRLRVEFGVVDAAKGKQALSVTVLDQVSVTKARRAQPKR